jgi:subtilisin family serine protease
VITAGAVRADDLWLGYSSQGPGQPLLGNSAWPGQFPPPINPNQVATEKPDLCAPSNFRESIDASVQNTGTSTSCALTAGVVAALRSNPLWPGARVAPVALKQALIDTARETAGPAWSRRFGNGILNADAARLLLRANFP